MSEFNQEKKFDAGKLRYDLIPKDFQLMFDTNVFDNNLNSYLKDEDYESIITHFKCCLLSQHLDPEEELAKVYTLGASRYGANSWQEVPDGLTRYKNALKRHAKAFFSGKDWNEEDGNVHHAAQVIWNCIAVIWFEKQEGKNVL